MNRRTILECDKLIGTYRLAKTARIRVHTDLAEALEKVLDVLDGHRRGVCPSWEHDMPIKVSSFAKRTRACNS